MFRNINSYPGDPILGLNEDFQRDGRAGKVNLGIGVYLNDAGKLPEMGAVRKARTALLAGTGVSPYLPMEGDAAYRSAARALVFGAHHDMVMQNRVATIQTVGGSGALGIGADFLSAYFRDARIWISDPTWDNHRAIFEGAGFAVGTYPYYCRRTGAVDFERMKATLQSLPKGDVVILHACCHNPTGADLNETQWQELAMLFQDRGLVPFFDVAYQGFGAGIEQDAFAVRHFAALGIPGLVACSFSKNFALYGERCGALHVICPDAGQADLVLGQLKAAVRRNYSSPPTFGSRLVSSVLGNEELHAAWTEELDGMRNRVKQMRVKLHAMLCVLRPDRDFAYLIRQHGMFSFTGLAPDEIRRLREDSGVYLVESGRICIAALVDKTVEPAAAAIARVLK